MNQYRGIPYTTLPDPNDPDFGYRLKNLFGILDQWSKDSSDAFGQIKSGYVPDGSGTPLHNSLSKDEVKLATGSTNLVQGYTDKDNIQEWYNNSSTRVAYVDNNGYLTVPYLTLDDPALGLGPKMTLDGYGNLTVSSTVTSLLTVTGNTDLQGQVLLSSLAGGNILTVVGDADFQGTAYFALGTMGIGTNGVIDSIPIYSSSTGNTGSISLASIGVGQTYTMPSSGGLLLTPGATATLANTYKYSMGTGSGGFIDSSVSTKTVRFDLTGLAASTTRNIKLVDISGSAVLVGNTTSASGTLGASSLTAQTGSIAAVTLLTGTTATAGMYRVSAYMKTTTAGTAGTVKATVAWNDGSAQTMDVPLITTAGAATTISLSTGNAFGQGSVVVYAAASQNITYTTTVAGATGSPQYYIYVRIEKL